MTTTIAKATITTATITTAAVAAGLLGITMLAGTPAMAATACHNHNNPAACRARRDAHRMRQENRALRQDIRAQNRYVRRYMPVFYPGVYNQPVYNPYMVAPAPGLTIRF